MNKLIFIAFAIFMAIASAKFTTRTGEYDSPIKCSKECKGECDLNTDKHKFECVEVHDWDCYNGMTECDCPYKGKYCTLTKGAGWCCYKSDKILNAFFSDDEELFLN